MDDVRKGAGDDNSFGDDDNIVYNIANFMGKS